LAAISPHSFISILVRANMSKSSTYTSKTASCCSWKQMPGREVTWDHPSETRTSAGNFFHKAPDTCIPDVAPTHPRSRTARPIYARLYVSLRFVFKQGDVSIEGNDRERSALKPSVHGRSTFCERVQAVLCRPPCG
jgi:hypothetical protein